MSPPVSARSTSVAMLLFFGLTAAAPARANVDASGRWFVEADSVRCQIELSSSGTQLVASGACFHAGAVDGAGTFDAASGHFSVSGSAEGVCDSFMVDATVAPDGTTFAGTFLCLALQLFPVRGNVTGSRCGDGLPACAIDDALHQAIEEALRDYERLGLRDIARAGAVRFDFAAPSSGVLEVRVANFGAPVSIADGTTTVETPAQVVTELRLTRRGRRLVRRRRRLALRLTVSFTAQGRTLTEVAFGTVSREPLVRQ